MPFFAGYHRTMGAGLRGLILPSAPGVCAWATPFCPFLAKTGGSRWDRVAKYIIFLPVRSCKRSIWVSVLASNFQVQRSISACSPTCRGDLSLFVLIVQRAQHAARPAGELSFPVVQIVQHTAPLVGESFSPGTTELNFQPHQSDMRSSLQQKAQTFYTQQRSRTH